LIRPVLAAEKPDLLGLLRADEAREYGGAEAAVERPDLRPGLPEARVVRGDRQVAHDVQDVAAADRVARHHRDHRLAQPADLNVQVGAPEPPYRLVSSGLRRVGAGYVAAALAPGFLIAAGAECVWAFAGQDDHADVEVLARAGERVGQLDDGLG